jgi:hypothetical protein
MRIPSSRDVPPPLFAPVSEESPEDVVGQGRPKKNKRRRGKKASGAKDHSWEQAPQSSRIRRGENSKMQMMLVAGGLLFAAIVAGMLVPMLTSKPPVVSAIEKPADVIADVIAKVVEVAPVAQRTAASILSEAEPLAKKFLEATAVDEVLAIVRNPGVAEARMREYYPDGKIEPAGLSKFNSGSGIITKGKLVSVPVITRDHGEKALGFVETPEGLKIDWESWVGWSELPWEKFLSTKPTTGQVFRVILSPVDYYNFGFSDDFKWQSYRLESPGKENGIYGYVERGSELDKRIRPNADEKEVMLTLSLKFPLDPKSSSQVAIEKFICSGWVEEVESP